MVSQVLWWALLAVAGLSLGSFGIMLVTGRRIWHDWPRPDASATSVRMRAVFPAGVSLLVAAKAVRRALDPAVDGTLANTLDAVTWVAVAVAVVGVGTAITDIMVTAHREQRAG